MADLTIDSNLSGAVSSTVSGTFGAVGPVTIGGIPSSYDIHIKEFPKEVPKIVIGVDPLDSKVHFDPISLKIDPIETSVSIKEIPSTRTHLPANYSVALSIFGIEIAAIRLCGEGQIITEKYQPNPCEICGAPTRTAAGLDVNNLDPAPQQPR
jgi:hypothetical protein